MKVEVFNRESIDRWFRRPVLSTALVISLCQTYLCCSCPSCELHIGVDSQDGCTFRHEHRCHNIEREAKEEREEEPVEGDRKERSNKIKERRSRALPQTKYSTQYTVLKAMGHLSSTSTSHGRTWGWVMLIGLVLSATTEFFVHRASHTSTADDTPQGYFPKGCVWRLAPGSENLCFWDLRAYEYLDIVTGKWQQEQPAACRLDSELTSHWERGAKYGSDGDSLKSLTTKVRCEKLYCVYWNAWYNNGSWYMLTDLQDHDTVRVAAASGGNQPSNGIVVSKDIEMFHISVKNASLFKDQVESRWIAGQTVLIDFLFFLHPVRCRHVLLPSDCDDRKKLY